MCSVWNVQVACVHRRGSAEERSQGDAGLTENKHEHCTKECKLVMLDMNLSETEAHPWLQIAIGRMGSI